MEHLEARYAIADEIAKAEEAGGSVFLTEKGQKFLAYGVIDGEDVVSDEQQAG